MHVGKTAIWLSTLRTCPILMEWRARSIAIITITIPNTMMYYFILSLWSHLPIVFYCCNYTYNSLVQLHHQGTFLSPLSQICFNSVLFYPTENIMSTLFAFLSCKVYRILYLGGRHDFFITMFSTCIILHTKSLC